MPGDSERSLLKEADLLSKEIDLLGRELKEMVLNRKSQDKLNEELKNLREEISKSEEEKKKREQEQERIDEEEYSVKKNRTVEEKRHVGIISSTTKVMGALMGSAFAIKKSFDYVSGFTREFGKFSAGGILALTIKDLGEFNRSIRISNDTAASMVDFQKAFSDMKDSLVPSFTEFIKMVNDAGVSLAKFIQGVAPSEAQVKDWSSRIRSSFDEIRKWISAKEHEEGRKRGDVDIELDEINKRFAERTKRAETLEKVLRDSQKGLAGAQNDKERQFYQMMIQEAISELTDIKKLMEKDLDRSKEISGILKKNVDETKKDDFRKREQERDQKLKEFNENIRKNLFKDIPKFGANFDDKALRVFQQNIRNRQEAMQRMHGFPGPGMRRPRGFAVGPGQGGPAANLMERERDARERLIELHRQRRLFEAQGGTVESKIGRELQGQIDALEGQLGVAHPRARNALEVSGNWEVRRGRGGRITTAWRGGRSEKELKAESSKVLDEFNRNRNELSTVTKSIADIIKSTRGNVRRGSPTYNKLEELKARRRELEARNKVLDSEESELNKIYKEEEAKRPANGRQIGGNVLGANTSASGRQPDPFWLRPSPTSQFNWMFGGGGSWLS